MANKYKIIVAGSRNFDDYEFAKAKILEFVAAWAKDYAVTLVSGGAKGADSLGERLAAEIGWRCIVVKPDWRLGRGAGPARNTRMAKMADALVAFHDGVSRGTMDMIEKARKGGLKVYVVSIPQ